MDGDRVERKLKNRQNGLSKLIKEIVSPREQRNEREVKLGLYWGGLWKTAAQRWPERYHNSKLPQNIKKFLIAVLNTKQLLFLLNLFAFEIVGGSVCYSSRRGYVLTLNRVHLMYKVEGEW